MSLFPKELGHLNVGGKLLTSGAIQYGLPLKESIEVEEFICPEQSKLRDDLHYKSETEIEKFIILALQIRFDFYQ